MFSTKAKTEQVRTAINFSAKNITRGRKKKRNHLRFDFTIPYYNIRGYFKIILLLFFFR